MTLVELRAFVRDAFPVVFDEPPLVKARVGDETVGFALIQYGEQSCVLLMVEICPELGLSPARALELNRDLGPASLVPVCGQYLLRQVMPLDQATGPAVRWTCTYLARTATRLRQQLVRPVYQAAFYAQYVD